MLVSAEVVRLSQGAGASREIAIVADVRRRVQRSAGHRLERGAAYLSEGGARTRWRWWIPRSNPAAWSQPAWAGGRRPPNGARSAAVRLCEQSDRGPRPQCRWVLPDRISLEDEGFA
ncbi:hypothetical protein GCM10023205_78870 [Yinghuangia aomiensis]|uniref:Uncharacterized protein n=1 Tax=Yinghuangia aomiensis TaxID=676205 RepID=A0ABP9IDB0_9ACTN